MKRFKEEANPTKISTAWAVLAVTTLLIYTAGCRTVDQPEHPQMSTVIGLQGDARYRDGNSNALHAIKLGDRIPSGSVIQTANGMGNMLALATSPCASFTNPDSRRRYDDVNINKVILYENSILKLSRVTSRIVGGKRIQDTRLFLLAGSALCDSSMIWPSKIELLAPASQAPKIQKLTPQPDMPYYEIRSSNTVVHAEHAVFFFAASGLTQVAKGTVALETTDTSQSTNLWASQQYDPITKEVSRIQTLPNSSPLPWDRLWPLQRRAPPDEIQQRPF